jgi:3-oxoacyl-[acyl-carrier protein] reductase
VNPCDKTGAIAPGVTETEMVERVDRQLIERLKSITPIGRIGDPQEIANAVVWLLSDKASFVLGHTLLVDGGVVSR